MIWHVARHRRRQWLWQSGRETQPVLLATDELAYESLQFSTIQAKKQDESLDSSHTWLRQLAKTCEFSNIDKEIKEHL